MFDSYIFLLQNPTLAHYSTYEEHELLPVAQIMVDYVLAKEPAHDCFYRKYASKKYMKASCHVRNWAHQRWSFQRMRAGVTENGDEMEREYLARMAEYGRIHQ